MKKYTHITKFGFGGLLKAGWLCNIVYQNGSSVTICIDDNGLFQHIWHGNINDLQPIK